MAQKRDSERRGHRTLGSTAVSEDEGGRPGCDPPAPGQALGPQAQGVRSTDTVLGACRMLLRPPGRQTGKW